MEREGGRVGRMEREGGREREGGLGGREGEGGLGGRGREGLEEGRVDGEIDGLCGVLSNNYSLRKPLSTHCRILHFQNGSGD